jgi:hypothetical protein
LPGHPQRPRLDNVLVVEAQGAHGGPTGGGQTDDMGTAVGPGQVFIPDLCTGIEKGCQGSSSNVGMGWPRQRSTAQA